MKCKILFLLAFIFLLKQNALAQREKHVIDSLTKQYNKEQKLENKAAIAGELSQVFMSFSLEESEKWGKLALENAELSRNKSAMVKANNDNGVRLLSNGGKKENIEKAKQFFETAVSIAEKNKLDKDLSESLINLAKIYRTLTDYDKALAKTTQAFSLANNIKDDSLIAACNLSFGSTYLRKEDKLMALRSYFEAANIAERTKNPKLIRNSYSALMGFYSTIKNYDKATDYCFKNLENAKNGKTEDDIYYVINDLYTLGSLYVAQKKYDLAQSFYEKSIAKADSIKFDVLKYQSYIGLFNMYLFSKQPAKALEFFKKNPSMAASLKTLGYGSSIDYAYAYTYSELNRFDSADYYYKLAMPFYETQATSQVKVSFYSSYADYLKRKGELNKAIENYSKTLTWAKENKDFSSIISIAEELDSAYQKIGNFQQALYYKQMHFTIKDSLDKLSKEDEILQLQLNDEEQRKERLLKEEEEKIQKRNSIQYLAIVIAIVGLFIVLTMMGMFKVSERTIKTLGFFSFLMLFEFIFLVLKTQIHHYTHGEPWKDLLALILIAAILVPLHHWLEHKVIHYLSSNHLMAIREKSKNWMPKFSKTPS